LAVKQRLNIKRLILWFLKDLAHKSALDAVSVNQLLQHNKQ
jgi:hypothetical protein